MLLGRRALGLKPRFFSTSITARLKATQPVSQTAGTGVKGPERPNIRDQYKAKNASGLYYTLRFVAARPGAFANLFGLAVFNIKDHA